MTNARKDKLIKEYMTFNWGFVEFFYAYCENKGIENPEEDLTEEEYERLEKECEEKITYDLLNDLNAAINSDIQERIFYAMG